MRRTGSSKGAIELPLTYVYAVLIGIVVFIIAARVIGVQGESASARNLEIALDRFDALIEAAAADPNVIQNLDLDRANVRLDWDAQSRIRIGSSSAPIRVPTFGERELSGAIAAWTYPFEVETASSPLLFLSDASIEYRLVNTGSLSREVPVNAADYGLIIGDRMSPGGVSKRSLCVNTTASFHPACDLRLVSEAVPYGYLSWNGHDRWYPTVSKGELFSALFAANEGAWNSTIDRALARDRINRAVLLSRAEAFEAAAASGALPMVCETRYEESIAALGSIATAIDALAPADAASTDLRGFDDIREGIEKLDATDSQLIRSGCPEVIG